MTVVSPNVFEVFEAYKQHSLAINKAADASMAQTALLRFTNPGWGGPSPKGAKATTLEVSLGLEFLKQISLQQFADCLAVQQEVFEKLNIPKDKQRTPRSYLKKLLDWATETNLLGSQQTEAEPSEKYYFQRPDGERRTYAYQLKQSGRPCSRKFILDDSEIKTSLKLEIEAFCNFSRQRLKHREPTVAKNLQRIKQILGWLHHHHQVPLEDLGFEMLIRSVPLQPKLKNYKSANGEVDIHRYAIAKALAQEEAQEAASETIRLVNNYFSFFSFSAKSNVLVLQALVNTAKFIYRDETNEELHDNFDDIPVILRLRKLSCHYSEIGRNSPHSVPYEQKSVPWEQVFEVLKQTQKEADLHFSWAKDRKVKRSPTAIARSVQKFLLVAFLSLIPPDRSRTYQELEVGRTFVQGHYDGARFTPIEKMKDPTQAEWWIHLMPEDFKTGDVYGEYWGLMPNTKPGQLEGGKTLYRYIDEWLKEHRKAFNPQHKCFFTGMVGQQMDEECLRSIFRELLFKFTGVPVTPKEMRRMYVTYLKEQGASEAELEAAAYAMHHDRKMQTEIYNQQTQQSRIAPIYSFNQRLLGKVLQISS